MTTASLSGPDSVAQFAALLQKFSRMEAINGTLTDEQSDDWTMQDERTLLIASGLFAIADQLQRIGDALTAPLPDAPLEIPIGNDDPLITE
mgnify:CR=1 FL=1